MTNEVHITNEETLSHKKYWLKQYTFSYSKKDGSRLHKKSEVYDVGNAASVLLYDAERKMVVLTRQFRMPTYLNGNEDGYLTEACAGKIAGETPEEGMKREIMEETGYRVEHLEKIMEVYTSPGSVSEMLYLYIAAYTPKQKTGEGGGLKEEQEYIEVLEMPFTEAWQQLKDGKIRDAKTVILLQYAALHLQLS